MSKDAPCPVKALQHYMDLRMISQREMADRLGCTHGNLSEIMGGRRGLSLRVIRNAVAMGMSASVMIQPTPYERNQENA